MAVVAAVVKFKVVQGEGSFSSRAVATQHISRGELVGSFAATATEAPQIAYTSVQVGRSRHIELNSDLVFLNHACDPSVSVDADAMSIIAARDIQPGDELTFFYPSTEWEMAQPFQCWCGAGHCLGLVQGAKSLRLAQLTKHHGFINRHILELAAEQEVMMTGRSPAAGAAAINKSRVPCEV